LLAAYRDHEDLISIGAYRRGANRAVDAAIDMQDEINRYLRQRIDEPVTLADAAAGLNKLHSRAATQMQSGNPAVAAPASVQQPNA
jgi:flagellum-specific ATP synthase